MGERKYDLIAFTDKGLCLDVRVDPNEDTVWLTQAEMAELFGIERPVILYHLRAIYRNEELSEGGNLYKNCTGSKRRRARGQTRKANL